MTDNLVWLYWCRGLTLERWRQECRLVDERLRSNLIRSTLLGLQQRLYKTRPYVREFKRVQS